MTVAPVPTTPGPGKPAGQVKPQRIIDQRVPLSQAGELWQESSLYFNVHAHGLWVTDGHVLIDRFVGDDFHRREWLRILGGTYAMYVTWVEIDDQRVSHPMAWKAYGETDADRQRLKTAILPNYRCMSQSTWRMFWRNFYQLNGGWSHTPSDARYASAYPYRVDPEYALQQYGDGSYPRVAKPVPGS